MAKMLIRTSKSKCRSLAVSVRIFMFFAIPFIYYALSAGSSIAHNFEDGDIATADYRIHSRHLLQLQEPGIIGRNCTPAAILEFPSDGLTPDQRRQGYIAIHCLLAVYCFLLLGVVCEDYFVPAIESICSKLNLADDIAGATFMAAASSSPELFINCVGTFVTEGDIGVGAVVGSAVFNVLAVPAFCGILAGSVINLDWWSLSRDCLMYALAVVALIITIFDSKIVWYEALMLVVMYVLYILSMMFNTQIERFVRGACCALPRRKLYTEITPLLAEVSTKSGETQTVQPAAQQTNGYSRDLQRTISQIQESKQSNPNQDILGSRGLSQGLQYPNGRMNRTVIKCQLSKSQDYQRPNGRGDDEYKRSYNRSKSSGHPVSVPDVDIEAADLNNTRRSSSQDSTASVWSFPDEKATLFRKVYWTVTWPISLLLWFTIPDCKKHPRMFPLTFIMCIAWIGGVSYLVAWIITILGDTLNMPDSITGLTILAAGTSLPEAIASVIVTVQGHGGMGISNSIGSNTFDILLCLGLPWLIKSVFLPTLPGQHWVSINSSGMCYSAISLLSTLFMMYFSVAYNGYRLDWRMGLVCASIYVCFLVVAALIELNIFFVVNLPVCLHS